jgi:hypothetical protein
MLRRVALVRTDVSEELRTLIIGVTRIGELGATLAVTSNRINRSVRRLLVTANAIPSLPIVITLMMEALSSSETSVLTTSTRRNIREDAVLHLLSYPHEAEWTAFQTQCYSENLVTPGIERGPFGPVPRKSDH